MKQARAGLCSHLEFRHQLIVRFCVFALQIFHQASSLADFFDEPAARGKIFFVCAQVLGEFPDFFGQDRDLDLGRTRIRGMYLEFVNDTFLFIDVQHMYVSVPIAPERFKGNELLQGRSSPDSRRVQSKPEGRR